MEPVKSAVNTSVHYSRAQLISEAWKRGRLRYKLFTHQLPIYDAVWNVINGSNTTLKYVVNSSRRFGKTFTLCVIAIEYAIRNKNTQIRFAAPTAKALRKIVFPIIKIIVGDCPQHLRPRFKTQDDVLVFSNGSELHLAGTDAGHEENLRGTASHLNVIDEAGSMDNLEYLIKSILMPQTLTTGGKTIVASTPSTTPAHDYYTIYRECMEDGNVSEFTINDHTTVTPEEIEQFKKESGGEQSTTWQREYLCKFVTDSDLAVIPEWDNKYVQDVPHDQLRQFYYKYVALDSGVRDLTAVLFAHYDFANAKLIIEDEFTINGPQMTTDVLAKAIKQKEKDLWGGYRISKRIADNNNLILVQDLTSLHHLPFIPTNKEALIAMVNEVRILVNQGRIIVHPRCEQLKGCLEFAVWNPRKQQMEFGRSKKYGHYDHLAALIYLVRNIDTMSNPVPPTFGYNLNTTIWPNGGGTPGMNGGKVDRYNNAFRKKR